MRSVCRNKLFSWHVMDIGTIQYNDENSLWRSITHRQLVRGRAVGVISINNFGEFTCADSFKQTHATHNKYITSVLIFRSTAGHRTRSAKRTYILWSGPTMFEPNCDGWWQPSWIEVVEIMGNMGDKRLLRGSKQCQLATVPFLALQISIFVYFSGKG